MKLKDGTPIDPYQFHTWLEALRSGNYKQIRGYLNKPGGHCCLGVACELFINDDKKMKHDWADLGTCMSGQFPTQQKHAPEWVKRINDDFRERNDNIAITDLNDKERLTFPEIADILEKTYGEKK